MSKTRTTDDPNDPRLGKQRLARERGLLKKRRRAESPPSAPDGVVLDRIKVVLVRTEHEGNIGRAARAMLNMGLTRMSLAGPTVKHLTSAARRPASSAWEVVKEAEVHPDLASAIGDTVFSIGLTSARDRAQFDVPPLGEVMPRLAEASRSGDVALVFGSEADGLTNDELSQCHALAHISASPLSPVLNLAQAIQVATYEVFNHRRNPEAPGPHPSPREPARQAELDHFFGHLFRVMRRTGFVIKQKPERFYGNVRRIFTRAPMEAWEVSLLRGILTSVEDAIDHPERLPKSDAAKAASEIDGGNDSGEPHDR